MEKFKKIKGYEDYLVSSYGRIISNKSAIQRELRLHSNGKGYIGVGLTKDGKTKRFLVHRLVAQAFISNKESKKTVNHIDENKTNNKSSNLQWMTQRENVQYSVNRMLDFPVSQYNIKDEIIAVWGSIREAGKCGFCISAINSCCKGVSETYSNFIWKSGINESELFNSLFIDMRTKM